MLCVEEIGSVVVRAIDNAVRNNGVSILGSRNQAEESEGL